MMGSFDAKEVVSKPTFFNALVSMSGSTDFSISGFDCGTYYSDCGLHLKDYGSDYSYGKPCKVYGQTDLNRYIYIFEFETSTSLDEFEPFLSSITKFSPEMNTSSIITHPVIVFDNKLRHSYSFMCGQDIVVMVSQDLSNLNQDENELQTLSYNILEYCSDHEIV
jgi:hypothetical protein